MVRRLVLIGAVGLALCSCAQETDSQIDAVELDVPGTGRLGMRSDLTLAVSGLDGAQAEWLAIMPGGPDGPDANPDGVMGASGQIDLNGDGRPETVQARLGGAGWSAFAVFESSQPDAKVLFRGDGIELLVSRERDVAGWPVLAMMTRDYDAPGPEGQEVMPDQVWTGAAYSPPAEVGPAGG